MKIGFDYDKTLTKIMVQNFVKTLLKQGYEIYVITKRYNNIKQQLKRSNKDLFLKCEELGINKNNIYFSNNISKLSILKNLNIDIFMDDNINNIIEIKFFYRILLIHFRNNEEFIPIINDYIRKKSPK